MIPLFWLRNFKGFNNFFLNSLFVIFGMVNRITLI